MIFGVIFASIYSGMFQDLVDNLDNEDDDDDVLNARRQQHSWL